MNPVKSDDKGVLYATTLVNKNQEYQYVAVCVRNPNLKKWYEIFDYKKFLLIGRVFTYMRSPTYIDKEVKIIIEDHEKWVKLGGNNLYKAFD